MFAVTEPSRVPAAPLTRRRLRCLGAAVAAGLLAACGNDGSGDDPRGAAPRPADPGPIHVHGLGVNPSDGALFIATHTGLFRLPVGSDTARRVGERYQDTMGFAVVGPDRFLGSGHPDGRYNLPPFLGLIRSVDAGRSWQPVSLLGKADFHVLETIGRTVYGYGTDFETRLEQLLVSRDGGRTWRPRRVPHPLISLAVDPRDPDRVFASGTEQLLASTDGARRWSRAPADPGLLTWSAAMGIFKVDGRGRVSASADGKSWSAAGQIGGQPAAFEVAGTDLYAALHDGTIKRSVDGGATWAVRMPAPR